MNIVFDIFLNNPELVGAVEGAPELNECFQEIFFFVRGRLSPLDEDITKEETDEPEKLKGTIIFLESSPDDPGRFLGFHGYSEELSQRMKDSFVENDIIFITEKVRTLLNRSKN